MVIAEVSYAEPILQHVESSPSSDTRSTAGLPEWQERWRRAGLPLSVPETSAAYIVADNPKRPRAVARRWQAVAVAVDENGDGQPRATWSA